MYHEISDQEATGRHAYYRTATHPAVFEQHVKFLRDEGYQCVTLSEALRMTETVEHDCARLVILTFDDGYQDFYVNAFPILNRYGFTATVFLPTAYTGETRLSFKGITCMTWHEVRELNRSGVEFGSHTVDHLQLRELRSSDVRSQLECSKEVIEQNLGCPVKAFAYPYAFPEADRGFVGLLQGLLAQTGYESGVSTIIGTADPRTERWFMPRLPINTEDDIAFFRAKVGGSYDWLHTLQYARKLCQGAFSLPPPARSVDVRIPKVKMH